MKKIKVTAAALNVREKPQGKATAVVYEGSVCSLIHANDSWSKVGFTGWVANKYLQEADGSPIADYDLYEADGDNPEEDQTNEEQGRIIERIVIHCSATPPDKYFTAADIKHWHTDPVSKGGRGWSRSGYHLVIERKPCRLTSLVPLDDSPILNNNEIANGARGYNRNSIHICYIGGVDVTNMRPENNITPEQIKILQELLKNLTANKPAIKNIVGHNDLDSNKACPSFNVAEFLRKYHSEKFANKYALK